MQGKEATNQSNHPSSSSGAFLAFVAGISTAIGIAATYKIWKENASKPEVQSNTIIKKCERAVKNLEERVHHKSA